MNRQTAVLLSIFFLFVQATVSGPARAIEFSKSDLKQLSEGKPVLKPLPKSRTNGFYGGAGFSLIDAPVDVIWKALEDWQAYPHIFPRTIFAEEVSRKAGRSLIKILLGYKLLSVQYYVTVERNWDKKTITFNLSNGQPHDIDSTKGYWKLMPQPDGRTLVAYAVAVQVPAGIVAFLGESVERSLERNLIGLPKYLKRYVESDAGKRYGRMTAKTP
jgi:ribosome-associated toxin RatA of RatAB toxin-antitoxin module